MIKANECLGWEPICIAESDIHYASKGLQMDVAMHNHYGMRHCGWSPDYCNR